MQKTALDIIRQISNEVEGKHVPLEIMLRDVQMMHFKIRSVIGDITQIEKLHVDFVESLWKIGKIDEIISLHIDTLSEDDQETLISYFENAELHMREVLKHSFELKKSPKRSKLLKLEISKVGEFEAPVN